MLFFAIETKCIVVHCLAHADYVQGYPSIRIDVYDGWLSFTNPGKCLFQHNNSF